jgi:hypothetical protein
LNEIATILGVDPIEALGFDHQNIFNNYGTQEGNIGLNQTFNYLTNSLSNTKNASNN